MHAQMNVTGLPRIAGTTKKCLCKRVSLYPRSGHLYYMVNLVEENKTVTVDGNVTLTNVTSLQAGRPVLVKRINILPMFDHKHF